MSADLEPLISEDLVILCHEPEAHWASVTPFRGLPLMIFNGAMGSPVGHLFWSHLLGRMEDVRDASDVFDATGPCLLDGVGGTMLLVDAALHRGGLRFPELPYDHLIETEAFGRLANDCGITPIGLPRVEVMHVPW